MSVPVHTKLLFAGKVSQVQFDSTAKAVQFCTSEIDLSYSTIDKSCNVRVHSIGDAFKAVKDVGVVTIVTPDNIITNATVTGTLLVEKKRLFRRPIMMLCVSFVGDTLDRQKLGKGTPFQLFAIDTGAGC